MADRYRQRLAHAKWTWRENRRWNQGKLLKDRQSGRFDKRGARAEDRREIAQELARMDAEYGDQFYPGMGDCGCSDCQVIAYRRSFTSMS